MEPMTDKAVYTPKLKLDEGNILHEDGRYLVEYDSAVDKIQEHVAIVDACNNYDRLLSENRELRTAAEKYFKAVDGAKCIRDGAGVDVLNALAELRAALGGK